MRGPDRQRAVYLAGVSGTRPRVPADATKLEARARRAMSREAFAYIAAGAGTEATVRANREAFERWKIVPRVLGDSPRWFQLYWSQSDDLVESLVARAEAARCEAIVVTLDTTLLGWRSRDLDLGYLPFLRGKGIAQYTSDKVFRRLLQEPSATEQPTPKPTLQAIRTLIQ